MSPSIRILFATHRRAFVVWLLLAALTASCTDRDDAPRLLASTETASDRVRSGAYDAAAPDAAPVTLEDLPRRERFWPYQVALTDDWRPPGWEGDFGYGLGVLLAVAEDGRMRVDFSRVGRHWVPARATDVLARANAVREGDEAKFGPNLVVALRNRLLDPSGRELRESAVDLLEQRALLLVFADPRTDDFPALAASLARVEAVDGVHTVLIARGGHADAHVYKACFDAGWKGAFLLDRFGPAYFEGYVGGEAEADARAPVLQLRSLEGRLLWQASWSPEAVAALLRGLRPA